MFFRKSVLGLCWLNVNYITFKASIEVWGMMLSCHTLWQNSKKTSHFNKGIYHFKQFSFSNVGSEVCYLEIRRFYVLTHEKWSAQILFLNVKSFNWTVSNRALFWGHGSSCTLSKDSELKGNPVMNSEQRVCMEEVKTSTAAVKGRFPVYVSPCKTRKCKFSWKLPDRPL